MDSKNNKETINLLDLLSETDSELSEWILSTPKKRKVKRRHRSNVRIKNNRNSCNYTKSKVRMVLLWLAAISITLWLIALSWLAGVLYGEIRRMDISIKSAIAGSENVPDALQKCHSLSKDLQKNQTILFIQLTEVKAEITNFTIQLSNIQQGLHSVQELLRGAPELASVPKKLKEALTSVATFGSKIEDLQASLNSLKETDAKLYNTQNILQENITNTKNSLMELSKINQKWTVPTNETKLKMNELTQLISQLTINVSNINETLMRDYQWLRQDQKQDHEKISALQDMTQNTSSKVLSLERTCANASEQTSIISSMKKLTNDVKQLEQNYNNLENSTNAIMNSVLNMKNHEQRESILINEQTSQLKNSTTGDLKTTTANGSLN